MESDCVEIFLNRETKEMALHIVPSGQIFPLKWGDEFDISEWEKQSFKWIRILDINLDVAVHPLRPFIVHESYTGNRSVEILARDADDAIGQVRLGDKGKEVDRYEEPDKPYEAEEKPLEMQLPSPDEAQLTWCPHCGAQYDLSLHDPQGFTEIGCPYEGTYPKPCGDECPHWKEFCNLPWRHDCGGLVVLLSWAD